MYRLNKDTELTEGLVQSLIALHEQNRNRYELLERYNKGDHKINYRVFEDESKPNNKIVNNYPSYIVDIQSGFFTGVPIGYNIKDATPDEAFMMMKDINLKNYEADVNTDLDILSCINGHSFELYWIDEEGEFKFTSIHPKETVMVYTSDVNADILYAIRYYDEVDLEDGGITRQVYVYDDSYVYTYVGFENQDGDMNYNQVSQELHYFDGVPVTEYLNNSDRQGSFEEVLSLIDAYNVVESDSVNEVNYFNDSYLLLKNMMSTTDEDIRDMKNNRVLLVDGEGDAKWLVRQIQDGYLENLKERISKDIHKFSKTPNLVSDEFVSNLSGSALRYKILALENMISRKEQKWNRSLRRRYDFLAQYLEKKYGLVLDLDNLEIIFNRNLPINVTELGQLVSQLKGAVSNRTLLGQIPFVKDVDSELEELTAEKEANISMFGGNMFGSQDSTSEGTSTEQVEEQEEEQEEEQ